MQAKLLALFVAQAAAVALPLDEGQVQAPGGVIVEGTSANKRAAAPVCNADNCLRNLRDARYSSSASAFCSTWIQSTVVNTFYDVATDRQTTTVTPPAATVTSFVVDGTTITTGVNTVTAYTTIPDPRYNKRAVGPYPAWLSASYPPERVSSACSCFITAPSAPIQQSTTLTTSTQTLVQTDVAPTPTNTVTQVSVSTSAVAATATAFGGIKCGIIGCRIGPNLIAQYYGTITSAAACGQKCKDTAGCKAFQFGDDGGPSYCNLGSVSPDTWYAGRCDRYKIYDVNCTL